MTAEIPPTGSASAQTGTEKDAAARRERRAAAATVERFVASLGLDAYLVGGVVRDELLGREARDADFLVLGLGSAELRARLEQHGRVEDLTVAGRTIGLRLYPRERSLRAAARAGIEFAPPRRERSTGPGRHDFDIVVDPTATVADDLARRDFTVNAIARRVGSDELVDPFGGRADLERGILRTVSQRSLSEDPLRIVRGLRFVSEFDLDLDPATLAEMEKEAPAVALVSGERIGGGLSADGMGELSKLLLGAKPAKALALGSSTGVLSVVLPPFADAIGFPVPGRELPLEQHLIRVVEAASAAGASLRVRLAALLHDLGKPLLEPPGLAHAELGAAIAARELSRLRYPAALRRAVVAIVRHHTLSLGEAGALEARRLLARYGEELALDLLDLHAADVAGKGPAGSEDAKELAALAEFRALLEAESRMPHRLADLAVDGSDLIAIGFEPGRELGAVLADLLDEVVEDPARNRRELLLARAAELAR